MHKIDYALNWLAQGVAVMPCQPNSKIPAIKWKAYQEKLPSAVQLERWFSGANNLAVITSQIAVLDFDAVPLYLQWRKAKPALADTYTVQTPRPGRHVYFRTSAKCKIHLQPGLDIKANGGYVLAPPSMVNYKLYRAIEREIIPVASFEEIVLEEWLVKPRFERQTWPRIINGGQSKSAIANIKAALNLYRIVAEYTELVSSSGDGRWYMGVCPAHNDHGPSLRVDVLGQKCYCYSDRCALHHPGGNDVVDFYAAVNRISIEQAIFELSMRVALEGVNQ